MQLSQRVPPTKPLIVELEMTTLQDRDFRAFLMNSKLRWSISRQVRDLRLSRGWTQERLASAAGLQVMTIQRCEDPDCANGVTLKTYQKIASAFDCAFMCRFIAYSEFLQFIASLEGDVKFNVLSFDEEIQCQTTRL